MLEQYKIYVADVGNIGTRYAATNVFYLSVITALLTLLALAGADKPLAKIGGVLFFAISFSAILICWVWLKTIDFYSVLFGAKFDVLREIEKSLDFKIYAREREILLARKVEWLTKNERRVPALLMWLFASIAVAKLIFNFY